MTDKSYIQEYARSDKAILRDLGSFIRKQRLRQHKTQADLAEASGISRSALSELENGKNSTLLTLVQVLRSLKLLQLLDAFESKDQLSPMQIAKLQLNEPSRVKKSGKNKTKPSTDW